ncbi:MAG TPA: hypothetical protein VEX39_08350 [Thermoleophilaceae bacterium]|nr:hypothetical protein [Thermoleophilaceae bacterium]
MAAAVALAAPAPAQAAVAATPELKAPDSFTRAPAGYRMSARQVQRVADRSDEVRSERLEHRDFDPSVYTRGPGRWQVSYFDGDREVAQVRVDDATGAVLEAWTGDQVAWTMARGYEGAFGRKLNSPWVWIPLCLAFLIPFVDPRRPFRLLHLDLLVLLAFGASHVFFNRGEIGVSVPLVYPVLLYLLVRLVMAGIRPRRDRGRLIPLFPVAWVAIALVLLVGFRVGLNVTDSNVIDVGYAGVIGADRIVDGDGLYGSRFSEDVERGDTYGPVNYLLYVPFEQTMPWSGAWDDLPAAHAAALAFDLLTLAGLVLLGMRLRPGAAGYELGVALGFAWAAYPYALFALETNSNDSLVGLFTVAAMLALTLPPARSAAGRAAAVALGAGAKFATLALAPLMAAGTGGRRVRDGLLFTVVLVVVLAAVFLPFLPDGGLREIYDRTVGYQASRPSPFSVWGQVDSLGWLQTAVKVGTAGLALAVAFVPRRRDAFQVAALGAAVVIAVQLTVSHWFYLYIVWFAPLALVALMAPWRTGPERDDRAPAAPGQAERPAVTA